MSKNKNRPNRKRRAEARSKAGLTAGFDDAWRHGPLTMKRKGRLSILENRLTDSDAIYAQQEAVKHMPVIRREIDSAIDTLLEMFSTYDPFDLIASIALDRCVQFLKEGEEFKDKKQADIEYLHSIAVARPFPSQPHEMTPDVATDLETVLDNLNTLSTQYYMFESFDTAYEESTRKGRFFAILRQMAVRNEFYDCHYKETFLDIFGRWDTELKQAAGLTSRDILEAAYFHFRSMESRMTQHLSDVMDSMRELKRQHALFQEWSIHIDLSKSRSLHDIMEEFRTVHHLEMPNVSELCALDGKKICQLHPRNDCERELFQKMALRFGDNSLFLEGHSRGWRLNHSETQDRPIVQHEDKLYMPDSPGFRRGLRRATERILKVWNPTFFERSFTKGRDAYLESKAFQLWSSMCSIGRTTQGAKYWIVEDGLRKQCEADIIAEVGDYVILIEAKASAVPDAAKRGAPLKLKDHWREVVGGAFAQLRRSIAYIADNGEAHFQVDSGKPFCLSRRGQAHIVPICVTLNDYSLPIVEMSDYQGRIPLTSAHPPAGRGGQCST